MAMMMPTIKGLEVDTLRIPFREMKLKKKKVRNITGPGLAPGAPPPPPGYADDEQY